MVKLKKIGKWKKKGKIQKLIEKGLKSENIEIQKETFKALRELGKDAIEGLLAALEKEGENSPHIKIIELLSSTNDKRIIEPLIEILLKNEDYYVRRAAAESLKKFAPEIVVKRLNELLEEGQITSYIHEKVFEALGMIGNDEALKVLITYIKKNSDSLLESTIISALGRIGDPRSVDLIIPKLNSGSNYNKKTAIAALADIGDPRAVKPIIQMLKDSTGFVREEAANALGKIGDPQAIDPLIDLLNEEKEHDVRIDVIYALGKLGGKRSAEALMNALRNQDGRMWTVQALCRLGKLGGAIKDNFYLKNKIERCLLQQRGKPICDVYRFIVEQDYDRILSLNEKALDPLIKIILYDENSDFRAKGRELLKNFEVKKVIQSLSHILVNEDNLNSIERAAKFIAEIESKKTVDLLINALEEENIEIRLLAAEALGEIGDSKAVNSLIELFKQGNADLKKTVAKALGRISSTRAVEVLIAGLEEEDFNIRYQVIRALAKIGDKRAVNPLIEMTKHKNDNIRIEAARGLVQISRDQKKIIKPVLNVLKTTKSTRKIKEGTRWAPHIQNSEIMDIAKKLINRHPPEVLGFDIVTHHTNSTEIKSRTIGCLEQEHVDYYEKLIKWL